MKILFLGDSITQGVGASCVENCYVSQVGKKLGCETRNYGISGTRIAKQRNLSYPSTHDMDFQLRASLMEKEADMVFVFGGTNDYGHGDAYIGEYDNKDPYTFYGAVRLLIEELSQIYGKEKLHFILPLHRFREDALPCKGANRDELGEPLEKYVEVLREVLEKYEIKYLDMYNGGFPKPMTAGDEYTTDGLHPNDYGHNWLADKICEYIKENS